MHIFKCAFNWSYMFFHEAKHVKCLFIFNGTKDLNNKNFNKLNEFQDLMVEKWKSRNFMLKLGKWIGITFLMQNWLTILSHGYLEKKTCKFKL